MASGPITSWKIDGKTMETVTDFIFLGSKITADGDCRLESILKSTDVTLPTKVHTVKAMVFPVVMFGCESWTIKKAECWRIGAFELWCWRRHLRVPWTARRSNKSILKEISPKYSLERLMLKLRLQYFGHLMERTDSLEKTLMLGKIEGGRRGQQRMRRLDGTTNATDVSLSKLWGWRWTGKPGVLQSMGHKQSDTTELLNWAELILTCSWLCHPPAARSYLLHLIKHTILSFCLHKTGMVIVPTSEGECEEKMR